MFTRWSFPIYLALCFSFLNSCSDSNGSTAPLAEETACSPLYYIVNGQAAEQVLIDDGNEYCYENVVANNCVGNICMDTEGIFWTANPRFPAEPVSSSSMSQPGLGASQPGTSSSSVEEYVNPTGLNPNGGDIEVNELPPYFPKRILFEKTASYGITTGWHSDQAVEVPLYENLGEENIVRIAYFGGIAATDESKELRNLIVSNQYATGEVAIDRVGGFSSYGSFDVNNNTRIDEEPPVGIKMASKDDSIIVYLGFLDDIPGNIKLSVGITQTTRSDQRNGPSMSDVENNYVQEPLKIILSQNLIGDRVEAQAGTILRKAYAVSTSSQMTGYGCFAGTHGVEVPLDDAKIKAYVHTVGANAQSTQIVYNAKEIPAGSSDLGW
jgi:hypothetical protein